MNCAASNAFASHDVNSQTATLATQVITHHSSLVSPLISRLSSHHSSLLSHLSSLTSPLSSLISHRYNPHLERGAW
jgi:hypothetical protein